MKILSLYYTDKPGGFCKRLYRMFEALHAAGDTVHYCSLDLPPDHVRPNIVFHKIPFWTSRRSGLPFWGSFVLWCPFYMAWAAIKVRPDRFAVFGAFYSAMLVLARLVSRAPAVLFLRSLVFRIDELTGKPPVIRIAAAAVERLGMRQASTLVCMTEVMAAEVRRFLRRPNLHIHILPNDLPPPPQQKRRFEVPPAVSRIALTSGVLDERKNVGDLLEVWAYAHEKGATAGWGLIIAGTGPLKGALQERAKDLKLTNVHFAGWVPELESRVGAVDLVIHPSLHEGVSNSALEAISAGVPILISDIPEHRELFPDERVLVNAVEWNEWLAEVLSNSFIRDKVREGAEQVAARLRFDWNARIVALIHSPPRTSE